MVEKPNYKKRMNLFEHLVDHDTDMFTQLCWVGRGVVYKTMTNGRTLTTHEHIKVGSTKVFIIVSKAHKSAAAARLSFLITVGPYSFDLHGDVDFTKKDEYFTVPYERSALHFRYLPEFSSLPECDEPNDLEYETYQKFKTALLKWRVGYNIIEPEYYEFVRLLREDYIIERVAA